MPANKKHHFVPQMYFRFFSRDGRSINVFNIKRETVVSTEAPIKVQCYRDYFYGKDGKHEGALAIIEGHAKQSIQRIISTECTPNSDSPDRSTMLMFLMLQAFRTGYQVDRLNDMVDWSLKYLT
jgi:hypothetical protein